MKSILKRFILCSLSIFLISPSSAVFAKTPQHLLSPEAFERKKRQLKKSSPSGEKIPCGSAINSLAGIESAETHAIITGLSEKEGIPIRRVGSNICAGHYPDEFSRFGTYDREKGGLEYCNPRAVLEHTSVPRIPGLLGAQIGREARTRNVRDAVHNAQTYASAQTNAVANRDEISPDQGISAGIAVSHFLGIWAANSNFLNGVNDTTNSERNVIAASDCPSGAFQRDESLQLDICTDNIQN